MRRKNVGVRLVLLVAGVMILSAGCATLGGMKQDPVRASLYAMKEEAVAIREYVITEHLAGRLGTEDLGKFKTLDDRFTGLYRLTLSLYLGGQAPGTVDSNSKKLQEILLELRRTYYPKGG